MDLVEKLQEYICYNQIDSSIFNVDIVVENENLEQNKNKLLAINNICILNMRKIEKEEDPYKKIYRKMKIYYAKLNISKR